MACGQLEPLRILDLINTESVFRIRIYIDLALLELEPDTLAIQIRILSDVKTSHFFALILIPSFSKQFMYIVLHTLVCFRTETAADPKNCR